MAIYSIDEIAYLADDWYAFHEELARPLFTALGFLECDDVKRVFQSTFIVPVESGSNYYSASLVRNRSLIIVDPTDLVDPKSAVVVLLHEIGHSLLGHGNRHTDAEDYERAEDQCWQWVRSKLPSDYSGSIDALESEGGGSKGVGFGRVSG